MLAQHRTCPLVVPLECQFYKRGGGREGGREGGEGGRGGRGGREGREGGEGGEGWREGGREEGGKGGKREGGMVVHVKVNKKWSYFFPCSCNSLKSSCKVRNFKTDYHRNN